MYKSSMRVSELLELARNAADIAPVVDDGYYLMWLGSLESLLYTGVIRESGVYTCDVVDGQVDLAQIEVPSDQSLPRGCDIRAVYRDGRELVRAEGGEMPRHPERSCFSTDGDRLYLQSPDGVSSKAEVVFIRRPAAKTAENTGAYVALPDEFLPMALDYLAGCAYALICQDNQAANRFAAYNAAMEEFAEWHKNNKGGNQ